MILIYILFFISLFFITIILLSKFIRRYKIESYQRQHMDFSKKEKTEFKFIPKKIFQLIPDKNKIHPDFLQNIDYIKNLNPDWEYILMDDKDIDEYIKKYYPHLIYYYNRINPKYGAARADFFRYLLMYKEGGAYFDIKSASRFPLNNILKYDDEYILSHFDWECHRDYLKHPYGEFQQWHIICRPNHPYLKAVIEKVIDNIESYNIDIGTGKGAVLKVTGPIAYTQAILPILNYNNYRESEFDEMIGLVYNNLDSFNKKESSHVNKFSKTHYSMIDEPVIL
jgi:mannosyltransferase OCH1-like enzyme